MRGVSAILLACSAVSLGGCIILFGPGDHDNEPTSSSGGGESCTVICDLPNHCSPSYCLEGVWGKRFDASANQSLDGLSVGTNGTIAIAGTYYSVSFDLGGFMLPPNPAARDGYTAFLDPVGGEVLWAQEMSGLGDFPPREGHGIAMLNDTFWSAGVYSAGSTDQNLGLILHDRITQDVIGQFKIGQENFDDVVAIVGDEPDAYAIGTLNKGAMDASFGCNGDVPYATGMFVVRFNGGACQWFKMFTSVELIKPLAIGLAGSTTHGIWFTGTFRQSIATGDLTKPLNASPSDSEEAFLIGMNADATIFAAQSLGPGVVPSAVTVGTDGTIYVAGHLYGSTTFNSDLKSDQTAAFVAAYHKDTIEMRKWVTVYPGSQFSNGGAKATAVAVDGTSVYVAGLFGHGIEIPVDKGNELREMSDANLFVARLRLDDGHTLAFHGFDGGGEKYDPTAFVRMSLAPTGVALAGAWSQTLNFATPEGTKIELLATGGDKDVFVVRLDDVHKP